ncbi:recombinase family protein [Paraconexibacter algicola]|uniref:Recombinase domain-containing protein n=1 Tax=Paraconexibacter algicola TaxID=2133960 RepID=A0A2T4UHD9_9ACTN|nr:recombinase family protein [Paraconexibacter algicola]PTL58663.1 hypothetical protein C7Y72_02845 [Paraconexibacter algicola]
MDRKLRVVIAIRVSSEAQVKEGYGHAAQRESLPKLVEAAGMVVAKRPDGTEAIYDEGFASTTAPDANETSLDHRPVFQQLLAELKDTQPDYLVCRQLDRLRRDTYEHEFIVKKLRAAGVRGFGEAPTLRELTLREIGDDRDAAMATIEAVFSGLQKADTKVKLISGRRHRAFTEKLPNGGKTPYGYRRQGKKEPLAVDEDEAATYRLMVRLVIDHGHGPAAIVNELTRRRVKTRGGGGWQATTVKRILESKAQCGFMRVRFAEDGEGFKWVPAAGQPKIIEEDEWTQMRAVLDARKRGSGVNQRRHVLAGLLRCAECGMTLKANPDRRRDKDGKRYINYSCRVYNSGCPKGHSISERKALRELETWVDEFLAATDAEGWRDDLATVQPADVGLLEERIATLAGALKKAKRAYDKAYSAWIDAEGRHEDQALVERDRRRDEVARIEIELQDAQERYGSLQTSSALDVSLDELRELLDGWKDFPAAEKREALGIIIDHAVLGPPGPGARLTVVASDGVPEAAKTRAHGTRARKAKLATGADADAAWTASTKTDAEGGTTSTEGDAPDA